MKSPFPGMDPYLEHPALWPDIHNSLITAIRDSLADQLAPRYYIGLERRAFVMKPDDISFIIGRPDVSVIVHKPATTVQKRPLAEAGVVDVEIFMNDEVGEYFLEVHDVVSGKLVTLMELLSPANKLANKGRQEYEQKREYVFSSQTHLVEIDLLRAGEPMPINSLRAQTSDYRILVSRAPQRPRAQLYPFSVRQPIPTFHLPLLPDDDEPLVDLGQILHALYQRARFDLRLDYSQPPVPPLKAEDQEWADALIAAA